MGPRMQPPHVTPQHSPQNSPQTSRHTLLEVPVGLSPPLSRPEPFDMWAAQNPPAEASQQVSSKFAAKPTEFQRPTEKYQKSRFQSRPSHATSDLWCSLPCRHVSMYLAQVAG